jgi:PE family
MSFMTAGLELITNAAQDLAGLHSTLDQATTTMAGPTTTLVPAASDEISGMVADLFNGFGHQTQALYAQASAFHRDFANLMRAGATSYAQAEAAGTTALASAEGMGAQAGNALTQLSEVPEAAFDFVRGVAAVELANTGGVVAITGQSLESLAGGLSSLASVNQTAVNQAQAVLAAGSSLDDEAGALAAVLAGAPSAFILQTGSGILNSLGGGLDNIGTDLLNVGLILAGEPTV